jgi:hypothetical protein
VVGIAVGSGGEVPGGKRCVTMSDTVIVIIIIIIIIIIEMFGAFCLFCLQRMLLSKGCQDPSDIKSDVTGM